MNYDGAINEINKILKTIEETITENWAEDVLIVIEQEICSAIANIYKRTDGEAYVRWNDQYYKHRNEGKNLKVDAKYYLLSQLLKMIKRDLEQRKRLAIQPTDLLSKPTTSYKLPFFLTLLALITVLIWMVPILMNKSEWFWQMVVQVLAAIVVGAVYFNFNRRKWYITVGIALVLVLAVILSKQEGLSQQLITAGWAVLVMVFGSALWELIKPISPKSKNS